MKSDLIEVYRPRVVADRGIWALGALKFKVYDLLADGKTISEEMTATARAFLQDIVMDEVEKMGDSNGLGFVIIHPGDLGLTIAAQWWAQGSVLCQRIYRRQYEGAEVLDTVARPAVACVWELEIIAAEQRFWCETMMTSQPDKAAYLARRAT